MKNFLLPFFIFSVLKLSAQNLVPNPDFENIMNPLCAIYGTNLNANVASWSAASTGTPDLITDSIIAASCGTSATGFGSYWGPQQPHSGKSMLALITYCSACASETREYVQAQLTSPLVIGQSYYAEVWISFADYSAWFTNNMGMYFSTNSFYWNSWVSAPFTPQVMETSVIYDSAGWYKVSGTFIADSAYDYLTIGNFMDDAQTTFVANSSSAYPHGVYYIDDADVHLSNQPPPMALFNATNHICPGTCTNFTNLSLNATSFQWTFAGASPSTSTDVNPTSICYNTPGSYDVSLIATNAITSDTLTLPNYITVYPYPPPQGIMQSGDTLFANAGAVSYQWYYGGNIIPGATDYFYVATQGGDYNVVATDVNSCEVEAAIFDVVAGIQSLVNSQSTFVFPNPVIKELKIKNEELKIGAAVDISIYNMLGEKIYSDPDYELRTVDCGFLPSGMYWLELTDGDKTFRNKFLKQ